jgi:hypothetical protein
VEDAKSMEKRKEEMNRLIEKNGGFFAELVSKSEEMKSYPLLSVGHQGYGYCLGVESSLGFGYALMASSTSAPSPTQLLATSLACPAPCHRCCSITCSSSSLLRPCPTLCCASPPHTSLALVVGG